MIGSYDWRHLYSNLPHIHRQDWARQATGLDIRTAHNRHGFTAGVLKVLCQHSTNKVGQGFTVA